MCDRFELDSRMRPVAAGGLGFRVKGLEFRVWVYGGKVWILEFVGFRAQGLGFGEYRV